MTRVPFEILRAAKSHYLWHIHGLVLYSSPELEKAFRDYVGITDRQQANYEDRWNIYVNRKTYKKLKVMATNKPEHWHTLFKVIEARCWW